MGGQINCRIVLDILQKPPGFHTTAVSPNVHISGSRRFRNTTKIPREESQREREREKKKERKWSKKMEKKAKFWAVRRRRGSAQIVTHPRKFVHRTDTPHHNTTQPTHQQQHTHTTHHSMDKTTFTKKRFNIPRKRCIPKKHSVSRKKHSVSRKKHFVFRKKVFYVFPKSFWNAFCSKRFHELFGQCAGNKATRGCSILAYSTSATCMDVNSRSWMAFEGVQHGSGNVSVTLADDVQAICTTADESGTCRTTNCNVAHDEAQNNRRSHVNPALLGLSGIQLRLDKLFCAQRSAQNSDVTFFRGRSEPPNQTSA